MTVYRTVLGRRGDTANPITYDLTTMKKIGRIRLNKGQGGIDCSAFSILVGSSHDNPATQISLTPNPDIGTFYCSWAVDKPSLGIDARYVKIIPPVSGYVLTVDELLYAAAIVVQVSKTDDFSVQVSGNVQDQYSRGLRNTVAVTVTNPAWDELVYEISSDLFGNFSQTVSFGGLPDGMYTISVRSDEATGASYSVTVAGGKISDIVQIAPPAPAPLPNPAPVPIPGPVLADCSFPAFTPNLWAYFGALFEWIGCILHNIIAILQWVVDWFLHFPDHLDAWVSRLFGIDPALPFWDELEKKLIAVLIAAAKQIIDILFADSDFWKNRKHPR